MVPNLPTASNRWRYFFSRLLTSSLPHIMCVIIIFEHSLAVGGLLSWMILNVLSAQAVISWTVASRIYKFVKTKLVLQTTGLSKNKYDDLLQTCLILIKNVF
jgi:hypothetical protein